MRPTFTTDGYAIFNVRTFCTQHRDAMFRWQEYQANRTKYVALVDFLAFAFIVTCSCTPDKHMVRYLYYLDKACQLGKIKIPFFAHISLEIKYAYANW